MSHTATHWIRILPDGRREIWQSKDKDAPAHPSDVDCCSRCPAKTWWMPLEPGRLLDAVAHLEGAEPCRCIMLTDKDGALETPKEARMGDHDGGRPFMARFSWTVGLSWEPPVEAREVEGVVMLFDREGGKKIATAPVGMSAEKAMHELRVARY